MHNQWKGYVALFFEFTSSYMYIYTLGSVKGHCIYFIGHTTQKGVRK